MKLDHRSIDEYRDAIVELLQGHDADDIDTVGGEKTGRPASEGLRAELHELLARAATDRPDGHNENSLPDYTTHGSDIPDPVHAVVARRQRAGPIERALNTGAAVLRAVHNLFAGALNSPMQPRIAVLDHRVVDSACDAVLDILGRLVSDQHAAAAALADDPTNTTLEARLRTGAAVLRSSHRLLAGAESAAAKARPPAPPPREPEAIWCTSHQRFDMKEPRGERTGSLCEWCAKFRAEYSNLPTKRILQLRQEGRRITTSIVDQELGQRRRRRRVGSEAR